MRDEMSATPDGRGLRRCAVVLIAGSTLAQSAQLQAADILKDDFESGTISSVLWNTSSTDGCSATVEAGGAADGTRYLRSTLTVESPGGNYRCEQNARGVGVDAKLGVTYYYGMAFRVPSDFAYDSQSGESIMQLHHQPTSGSHSHHAIRINDRKLEWVAHGEAGGPSVDLAPLTKGEWTRVCVRATWTSDGSGNLRVWLNADLESRAPTFQWNGQTVPVDYTNLGKFKVGIYKPKWRTANFPTPFNPATSPRIVEHDDIRVGTSFSDACGLGGNRSESTLPEPPVSVAVE